jgi:hypothetical protein
VAVVCLFAVHLTGSRRQQLLQGPKTVLDLVALPPCPYESWPTDGRVETHHIELIFPNRIDYDERHRAICCPGSPEPRIAHFKDLLTGPPRSIVVLLQVLRFDLPPFGQPKDIGTFSFDKEGPLVHRAVMAHEL